MHLDKKSISKISITAFFIELVSLPTYKRYFPRKIIVHILISIKSPKSQISITVFIENGHDQFRQYTCDTCPLALRIINKSPTTEGIFNNFIKLFQFAQQFLTAPQLFFLLLLYIYKLKKKITFKMYIYVTFIILIFYYL